MAPHRTFTEMFSSSIRNDKFYIFLILVAIVLNCKRAFGQMVTSSPLCASNLYNIEMLIAAPYWTITQPGICYHTWTSQDMCTINLAFCQALPLDKTGGQANMGASQELTKAVGATPLVLGQMSNLIDDNSGSGLLVTYPDGDQVNCGHISVLLELRCKYKAGWELPLTPGQPGLIPGDPLVVLDNNNGSCIFYIFADYAGACEMNLALSVGTILIIIFFCLLTVYLIAGMIYNKSTGATGKEVIPNYDTWNRLPQDVMNGCGFFFSCITCQGGTRPTNDTYDTI